MDEPTMPDFGGQVENAANTGLSILTDNVAYLLLIPVAWVGYKVVRKVIAKIG